MQVPGPAALGCVNSIGGRTDEIRLRWLGPLGGLAYQWQMTAPLSIFPVYHSGSPWQPVLCLWFRPRKTPVATSCDASRKSLKLQQKPICLSSSVAGRCALCVVSKTKKHRYKTDVQVTGTTQRNWRGFSLLDNYKKQRSNALVHWWRGLDL